MAVKPKANNMEKFSKQDKVFSTVEIERGQFFDPPDVAESGPRIINQQTELKISGIALKFETSEDRV